MYCKNCGREIDSDARFCPVCGFDQTRGSTAYSHVDPAPVRDSASVQEAKEYNQYLLSHDGNPPW